MCKNRIVVIWSVILLYFSWHFTTRHQQLLPQLLAVPLRSGIFACTKFRLHKDFLGWNAQPVRWINTPAMLMATWSYTVISLQESKLRLSFFYEVTTQTPAEWSHSVSFLEKGHTLSNKFLSDQLHLSLCIVKMLQSVLF